MLQTIRRGTGGFAATHPLVAAIAVLACGAARALAQEDAPSGDAGTQADLAAAAQNPIAAMVSLPIQNNTFFRTGPITTPPTLSISSRSFPSASVTGT